MATKGQIGIILFCLFASFATAQSTPNSVKEVVRDGLDSIARARGYELLEVNTQADSSIRQYVDERISPNPKAILFVQYVQLRGDYREGRMLVTGTILPLSPPKSSENFSFVTAPTGKQIIEITKFERTPPKEEEGFWDSVLQPALITLGSVTIIALFFFIRS